MLFTIGGHTIDTMEKQGHSAKEIRRAANASHIEAALDKARRETYMRLLIGG